MAIEERHILSRRGLLKVGGAAAVVAVLSPPASASALPSGSAQASTGAWNHNPASPLGPRHWADIGYPTCGQGVSQSPVDIRTGRVAGSRGAAMVLTYESSELAVENTGHVVEVSIPAGVQDTMRIGGDRYELVQYHFHTPSEYTVDGRHADVEAHFVHMNANGATAVVGVFYRRGPHSNGVLDKILLSAPEAAGEEAVVGEASPAELFQHIKGVVPRRGGPTRVNSFYSYDGSLTTPGCGQDVRWSVLTDGGQVSPAAVAHLHHVIARFPDYDGYPNNNRPVQPLNGRVVRLRCGA